MAALLDDSNTELSERDLDRLEDLISQARSREK
jgi:hypothetical protein